MTTLNRQGFACALSALVVIAGCAKTTDMPSGGSESHFLMACEDTSECGSDLECHRDVCTRECASDAVCEALSGEASCLASEDGGARYCGIAMTEDAGAPDAEVPGDRGVPEPGDIVGESEPLGEPVQMALIAGTDDEEQIWLRGEGGALRQLSVWPVDAARADSCEDAWSTGGYPSGWGRFAGLTFDPSGRLLVFSESLECGASRRERVIAHELATGRSRALLDLAIQPVIVADKHALVVVDQTESDPRLYELDPDAAELQPIDIPPGNTLAGGVPQLVSLGDQSILLVPNLPVLRRTDAGFAIDPVFDNLAPDYGFSPTGGNALGTLVCAVLTSHETAERLALLISPDDTWLSNMSPADDRGGRCAVSAEGEHMMFDTDAYERLEGGPMTPLSGWPFTGHVVQGAFGEAFYAATPEGAIARLDLRSVTSETVVELADVERLCGDVPDELAVTELIMPYDERPVAIVKRHCGCTDCDISGSLALRLDRATHETVELQAGEHVAYGVVWPVAGGALVLSTQGQPGGERTTPEYVAVSEYGETESALGLAGAPLLHGGAAPRRRATANAAPARCELSGIADLLLRGQPADDCGYAAVGENRSEILACAGDAYDGGRAFRVVWQTQGDDSRLESGLVGRVTATGYELYDLQYDSFGWSNVGTSLFTVCVSHSSQPCTEASGECPSCDAVGVECGCMPHEQSENGVELRCGDELLIE